LNSPERGGDFSAALREFKAMNIKKGAKNIAPALGLTEKQFYYLAERGLLPFVGKIGQIFIADIDSAPEQMLKLAQVTKPTARQMLDAEGVAASRTLDQEVRS
jgi:hypothetical protein